MKRVTFVTGNGWKHDEAKRLLSGLEVAWRRLSVPKPAGAQSLQDIATARVREAFQVVQGPVFLENTGLFLREHHDAPGTAFKKLLLELGEVEFGRRFGGSTGVTRLVVAYTEQGDDVQLFEGQNEGRLLSEPRGEGGYGWDRWWVPNGYERTLAELASAKFLVNMRHLPFLDLAQLLRGTDSAPNELAMFEAHVTVAPCDVAAFARACETLQVKCILIELSRGAEPLQPMTGSLHQGTLLQVQHEVHELARGLLELGFNVTRTKIEAVGSHADQPKTDDVAAHIPSSRYFEHHLKLAVPEGVDFEAHFVEPLRALGAHVSRNSKKPLERFVTLRSPGVGQSTADARFALVEAFARENRLPIRNRVREYTVYDSAPEVDRGWLR